MCGPLSPSKSGSPSSSQYDQAWTPVYEPTTGVTRDTEGEVGATALVSLEQFKVLEQFTIRMNERVMKLETSTSIEGPPRKKARVDKGKEKETEGAWEKTEEVYQSNIEQENENPPTAEEYEKRLSDFIENVIFKFPKALQHPEMLHETIKSEIAFLEKYKQLNQQEDYEDNSFNCALNAIEHEVCKLNVRLKFSPNLKNFIFGAGWRKEWEEQPSKATLKLFKALIEHKKLEKLHLENFTFRPNWENTTPACPNLTHLKLTTPLRLGEDAKATFQCKDMEALKERLPSLVSLIINDIQIELR